MIARESNGEQLIPPPELAPPSVKHLPLEKRIEIWAQLVDETDALVRAGLRAKIGPEGDLEQAYREWYARRMEEHERDLYDRAERLNRLESARGE
ncbi:MAG: hypothetical protein AB7G28_19035 [Pirellulales bacterium]